MNLPIQILNSRIIDHYKTRNNKQKKPRSFTEELCFATQAFHQRVFVFLFLSIKKNEQHNIRNCFFFLCFEVM